MLYQEKSGNSVANTGVAKTKEETDTDKKRGREGEREKTQID
jgi:hypothetical protein